MNNIGKIKGIFFEGWTEYQQKNSVRYSEVMNVSKMLACRTPLLGYHQYACPSCGETKYIPHSCKSRFCSICGTVATQKWINKQFSQLLECPYQHVVVTVPFNMRWVIKRMRNKLLNEFAYLSAFVIQEWANSRGYEVGIVSFFHSFGERLQFHPHFHLLVTSGGITKQGTWKSENSPFPGHILMKRFKAKFTLAIKDALKSGKIQTKKPIAYHLKQMDHLYDEHWQFYTERITKRTHATILYIIRYVKRMILSEKRIVSFNSKEVCFLSKLGPSGKVLIYKLDQFIKCVVQHIPEKHFRHIRYYGFYANASKKYKIATNFWSTIKQKVNKITWQTRQWAKDKQDPLYCYTCKQAYQLIEIKNPKSWVYFTYDQLRQANGVSFQTKLKWEYG